jgi:uncharacterized membrane protein YgcG
MTEDIWEEQIRWRKIKGLRLVICDDMATDPIGKQWLNYINGSQRVGGQIGQLRHPPDEGGAQAVLMVVAQAIVNYIPTNIRRRLKRVVSFQDSVDDEELLSQLYEQKGAVCKGVAAPSVIKSALKIAFPRGADGERERGCIIWSKKRKCLQKNLDQLFDFSDPYCPLKDLPPERRITTPRIKLATYVQSRLARLPPPQPPPIQQQQIPFHGATGHLPADLSASAGAGAGSGSGSSIASGAGAGGGGGGAYGSGGFGRIESTEEGDRSGFYFRRGKS